MRREETDSCVVTALILLLYSAGALAQGVPLGNGVYACDGAAQAGPCQPDADDYGAVPAAPPARWVDRWGAIASDRISVFGIVSDKASKSEAERAALSECRTRGGGECQVTFAYHNQCAAVAAGQKGTISFHAPTVEEAIEASLKKCEVEKGGECRVYYSGCSLPVRVQ